MNLSLGLTLCSGNGKSFVFRPRNNAEISTEYTSNAISIPRDTASDEVILIDKGSYRFYTAGVWGEWVAYTVEDGVRGTATEIQLKVDSSDLYETSVTVTLTIKTIEYPWTVTTKAEIFYGWTDENGKVWADENGKIWENV